MNSFLVEMNVRFYFGNKLIGMGYLIHGLYYINNISNNKEPRSNMKAMLFENVANSKHLQHLRLCHIAEDRITKLERMGILSNLESGWIHEWPQGTSILTYDQINRGVRKSRLLYGFPSDRKSTRLNSSHSGESRMPSSA